MGFRPSRGGARFGHSRRAAVITDQELADTDPDPLTLLKRLVNDFDELEVSDPTAWETAVAAIVTDVYKKLFEGGNLDRLRFRYAVYGYDADRLEVVYNELETALGP